MSLDERFSGLTTRLPNGSILFGLRGSEIEARYRSVEHLHNALAQWERKAGRPLTRDDLISGLPLEKDISDGDAFRRFAVVKRQSAPRSSLDEQEAFWRDKLEEERVSRLSRAEQQLEQVAAKRLAAQSEAEKAEAVNDAARQSIAAHFDKDNKLSDVLAHKHAMDLLIADQPLKAEEAAKAQAAKERARIEDASTQVKRRIEELQAEEAALQAELNPEAAPPPAKPAGLDVEFRSIAQDAAALREQLARDFNTGEPNAQS